MNFITKLIMKFPFHKRDIFRKGAICTKHTMSAWNIHKYGGVNELTLSKTVNIPVIEHPQNILIKVHAASINPIDTLIMGGYGERLFGILQNIKHNKVIKFPLILGRDFSGMVVDTGKGVNSIKPGDEVWGCVEPLTPFGSHSQFTKTSLSLVSKKPPSLSHVEAASLPYVAMTTWSALVNTADINQHNATNMRVLILGGSGGIGSFAIQMLKCWGVNVTATCHSNATELISSLGADCVVNYDQGDILQNLKPLSLFNVVYDTVGGLDEDYLTSLLIPGSGSVYVTIVTPALRNIDKFGFLAGMAKNVTDLAPNLLKNISKGNHYRWSFFQGSVDALDSTYSLIENKQLKPVIDKVFDFENLPAAFKKIMVGHTRGKTVIDMSKL